MFFYCIHFHNIALRIDSYITLDLWSDLLHNDAQKPVCIAILQKKKTSKIYIFFSLLTSLGSVHFVVEYFASTKIRM